MGVQRGRGFRPYGVFLQALLEELQSAIAEVENFEFHHAAVDSPEYQHYLRLATWLDEVERRVDRVGDTKVRKAWRRLQASAGPAPRGALADQADQQHLGGGHPDGDRPGLSDGGHSERDDGGQNPS